MRRINHYIGISVAGSILVVLLVIVALDVIAMLVDQLDNLKGNYVFSEAVIFTLLSMPSSIYEFLPLASLVGCLIGLGLLANTSELTVIRAAGVSVVRIIWAVMRPVLLFVAIALVLGEYVTPTLNQYAESRRAIALGHATALTGQRGVWNREGKEYMHFSAVLPNGKLLGLTRMLFDEHGRLLTMTYVESAIYQGDHWFEQDGVVTQLTAEGIHTEKFDSRRWQTEISPKLLSVIALKPSDLPMQRLLPYAEYLEKQGQNGKEYRLAFWQKSFQPLATLSLVMIAISFVFGPLRQVTMGFRVFAGVIVGIVFQTAQDLLGPSSILFGFAPLIAVLAPILLSFAIGVLLLRRSV
ncbi:LPS export ABC transporter permease LptG [Marinagarivorans algicola]|uniref:LPS export ABC transporter permease LptG n=1 Tax=Marinagarivorans algicola TaxID=1513270 RepID=UPI0006B4E5D9|nr:LPS export ABC transporter permease LptG [Marinagarivorans algicola]